MIIGYKAKMTEDSLASFETQFEPVNGTIQRIKDNVFYRQEHDCIIIRTFRLNKVLDKFFYEYIVINKAMYDKIRKENPSLDNTELFFDTDYFCVSPSYK